MKRKHPLEAAERSLEDDHTDDATFETTSLPPRPNSDLAPSTELDTIPYEPGQNARFAALFENVWSERDILFLLQLIGHIGNFTGRPPDH